MQSLQYLTANKIHSLLLQDIPLQLIDLPWTLINYISTFGNILFVTKSPLKDVDNDQNAMVLTLCNGATYAIKTHHRTCMCMPLYGYHVCDNRICAVALSPWYIHKMLNYIIKNKQVIYLYFDGYNRPVRIVVNCQFTFEVDKNVHHRNIIDIVHKLVECSVITRTQAIVLFDNNYTNQELFQRLHDIINDGTNMQYRRFCILLSMI